MVNQFDSIRGVSDPTGVYTNFTDLNSIRQRGREDQTEAINKIAKQFESILLNQMIKSMRQANDVFAKDSPFNTSEMQFHRDMLDHQWALTLSEGDGIGIADALVQQLQRDYGRVNKAAAERAGLNGSVPVAVTAKRYPTVSQAIDEPSQPALDGVAMAKALSAHLTTAKVTRAENTDAAAPRVAPKPAAVTFDGTPAHFINTLRPYAEKAAERIGVDPNILIAQAALETGWGKYVSRGSDGESSLNLFNIKADRRWKGDSVAVNTLEYREGLPQREVALFRRYDSIGQSFADYVDFINENPRYTEALKQVADPAAYVRELQRAGYATDPAYADKIMNIFQGDSMRNSWQMAALDR